MIEGGEVAGAASIRSRSSGAPGSHSSSSRTSSPRPESRPTSGNAANAITTASTPPTAPTARWPRLSPASHPAAYATSENTPSTSTAMAMAIDVSRKTFPTMRRPSSVAMTPRRGQKRSKRDLFSGMALVRGTASGRRGPRGVARLVVAAVRRHDVLYQLVPNDVAALQVDEREVLDAVEDIADLT